MKVVVKTMKNRRRIEWKCLWGDEDIYWVLFDYIDGKTTVSDIAKMCRDKSNDAALHEAKKLNDNDYDRYLAGAALERRIGIIPPDLVRVGFKILGV